MSTAPRSCYSPATTLLQTPAIYGMAKKIRFGLIGFGAWGRHHARALGECPETELVAISAQSAATQTEARRLHPGVEVFSDYRELLARPDIEAVDIVLPTDLHFPVASDAL